VPARAGPLQANKARKPSSSRARLRSKCGKEIARNGVTNKKKDAFAMNAVKRVTWAKIAQMVTFLNQTSSIMIFISLGTIKMELVL
jgi:hypothetical protein